MEINDILNHRTVSPNGLTSKTALNDSNNTKIDFELGELLKRKELVIRPTAEWIADLTRCFAAKFEDTNTSEFIITVGTIDEQKAGPQPHQQQHSSPQQAQQKQQSSQQSQQQQNGDTGLSDDDDLEICRTNIAQIANSIGADCTLLCRKTIDSTSHSSFYVGEFLVRKKPKSNDFVEVRIAVAGNVDSGKSTLLGVLTSCELDNGRGLARQRLFRHKHELESGRTSSIGTDIIGFDNCGNLVNKPTLHGNSMNWQKICEESSKVITFIDLAGHEKYLKTTIFGMTGHSPDYTLLMVGANAGLIGMAKEHLGVTLALNIPVFVVITKIDMCPPNILQQTVSSLKKVLKSPGCRKIPILIESDEDVIISASNFVSERLCPIFRVSNVAGTNLNFLKKFLNLLNSRAPNLDAYAKEFQIDEIYSVPGVGTVVSGLTLKGVISVNDVLMLGPNSLGNFIPAAIKSIHRKRLPVKEVHSGQTASFALKKIRRNEIRKGMVMLCPSLNPKAFWEFEGEIVVLHHPTTISTRYQAMVHSGSIRQTAQIVSMSRECLRTGDKAKVHFRFIKNPEYLHPGMRIIFREGRTKAIGNVTKLLAGSAPSGYHHHKNAQQKRHIPPLVPR